MPAFDSYVDDEGNVISALDDDRYRGCCTALRTKCERNISETKCTQTKGVMLCDYWEKKENTQ